MDKKQSITIPKFLWVLAGILVVCIIFLIAVQIPFSGKIDKYNKAHESATSQIEQWKDYLARAEEVTKKIEDMKAECSKLNDNLTIDIGKTADDIRDMLKNVDYDADSFSVSEGKADKKGGTSATGDPLYVTNIKFKFTATEKKLIETLNYFEVQSKGSYYVSQIKITEQNDKTDLTSADGESSAAASKTKVDSANRIYTADVQMSLYYFDPSKNKANNTSSGAVSGTSSASSAVSA